MLGSTTVDALGEKVWKVLEANSGRENDVFPEVNNGVACENGL